MSGGFNSYESTSPTPERLLLLREAIKTINADFIGLIDTFRWGEVFTPKELKDLFGYREVFQTNLEDSRVAELIGITVLSRLPIKKFASIRLCSRNAIKTQLEMEGKEIEVFTIYLDDLSEETRLNQIAALFNEIQDYPSVIMGDFNALCREDIPEVRLKWNKFLEMNPGFKKNKDFEDYFVPAFNGLIRGEVIEEIKKRGFKEAKDEALRKMTFPTPVFLNISVPYLKIDHIFYTPDIMIKNFQVLTGGIFDKASDHYPIVGELSFS
jgi:endonuclease/exonuclease/phosphatase family metal-dependent hydrolase